VEVGRDPGVAQLRADQVGGPGRIGVGSERPAARQRAAGQQARDRDPQQQPGGHQRGPAEAIDEPTPGCEHPYCPPPGAPSALANTADSDMAARASTASSASNSGSTRLWTMIPRIAAQTAPAMPRAGVGSASRSASTWRAIASTWP